MTGLVVCWITSISFGGVWLWKNWSPFEVLGPTGVIGPMGLTGEMSLNDEREKS